MDVIKIPDALVGDQKDAINIFFYLREIDAFFSSLQY